MKLTKVIQCLLTGAALAFVSGSFQVAAQTMAGPPSGMNAVMSRLLRNNAFTAKAELRVLDKNQKETTLMPIPSYAMLDGKSRFELDMSLVKSADIPAGVAEFLKQVKMDRTVIIIRPDKKTTVVSYPEMQAYTETPFTKDEEAEQQKNYKIDKTKQGKETLDGHACDKNTVVLTDDKGQKQVATVWNATDLKDFPIQLQLSDSDNSIVMKFKDVKLARPDAKQFEAPAGWTKYDASQMLKKLSSMGDKK